MFPEGPGRANRFVTLGCQQARKDKKKKETDARTRLLSFGQSIKSIVPFLSRSLPPLLNVHIIGSLSIVSFASLARPQAFSERLFSAANLSAGIDGKTACHADVSLFLPQSGSSRNHTLPDSIPLDNWERSSFHRCKPFSHPSTQTKRQKNNNKI